MGRYIVKIEDKYLEWSTVCDAPVTDGMTLDQLREHIKAEYGRRGLEELPARLERVEKTGTSGHRGAYDELISVNRAGPNEERLTEEEIYRMYCMDEDLSPEELAGREVEW